MIRFSLLKSARLDRILLILGIMLLCADMAFANPRLGQNEQSFVVGLWHGVLAPWTLLVRLFLDVKMYACENPSAWYDFGFVVGVLFSLPIGWITMLFALLLHYAHVSMPYVGAPLMVVNN